MNSKLIILMVTGLTLQSCTGPLNYFKTSDSTRKPYYEKTHDSQSLTRNLRALNVECDLLDERLIEYEQALMGLESKSSSSEINKIKHQMKDQGDHLANMQRTLNNISDSLKKTTPKTTTAQTSKKTITTSNTTYSVASGDTLSKIAKKYGVSINDLKETNHLTSDFIRVGQKIVIPKTS